MSHSSVTPISKSILGLRIDAVSYELAARLIISWASKGESRSVIVANVHTVMEAHADSAFQMLINEADLVTSDGMPLVWGLRALGIASATRVYGPALTEVLLQRAEKADIPVGFHGGRPDTLSLLVDWVRHEYPGLRIAYDVSPPYGEPSQQQLYREAIAIDESGVRILFVGLGCPKQERWIAAQRGQVPSVMIGVGAAFDFLSGVKPQAPIWIQNHGLEWAFRLATEPGRLWRRYLINNPRFLALFSEQLIRERRDRRER